MVAIFFQGEMSSGANLQPSQCQWQGDEASNQREMSPVWYQVGDANKHEAPDAPSIHHGTQCTVLTTHHLHGDHICKHENPACKNRTPIDGLVWECSNSRGPDY